MFQPNVLRDLILIADGMSPVGNGEQAIAQAILDLREAYGDLVLPMPTPEINWGVAIDDLRKAVEALKPNAKPKMVATQEEDN